LEGGGEEEEEEEEEEEDDDDDDDDDEEEEEAGRTARKTPLGYNSRRTFWGKSETRLNR
jgi:hypothetical protein